MPSLASPHPCTNIHQWLWLSANGGYQLNSFGGHPFGPWVCLKAISKLASPTRCPGRPGCQWVFFFFPINIWLSCFQTVATMSSAETNTFFICLFPWFWKKEDSWKMGAFFTPHPPFLFKVFFVLCCWVFCSGGSMAASSGTLHSKVTLIK